MKRFVITSLVLGIALLGLQTQAQANLLTDPSFEYFDYNAPGDNPVVWYELDWPYAPWYGGGGCYGDNPEIGGFTAITPTLGAHNGPRAATIVQYGDATGRWAYAVVGQVIPVSGNTTYDASVFAKKLGDITDSQALIKITWLNTTGDPIGKADEGSSQLTQASPDGWVELSDNFQSPFGAVGAEFQVVFNRANTSIDPGDILVDDAYFNATPEPATMLLFGSGLVALFGFSRRKRS